MEEQNSDSLEKILTSQKDIDIITFQKMIFIYNAVSEGWRVRKISDKKFEFYKKNNNKVEFSLDTYLNKFIMDNLNIYNIINNKKYL